MGAAEAWERDLAVWLGLAGAVSESSSSSSSESEDEEEGMSPGAATFLALRAMAASFLALAAARRCSRVRAGLLGSSESEEDSSEEESSEEDEAASCFWWGSWWGLVDGEAGESEQSVGGRGLAYSPHALWVSIGV